MPATQDESFTIQRQQLRYASSANIVQNHSDLYQLNSDAHQTVDRTNDDGSMAGQLVYNNRKRPTTAVNYKHPPPPIDENSESLNPSTGILKHVSNSYAASPLRHANIQRDSVEQSQVVVNGQHPKLSRQTLRSSSKRLMMGLSSYNGYKRIAM